MERKLNYDILRGVSCLLVVLYHFTFRFHEIFKVGNVHFLFKYGFLGVPVFFVLSGILIFKSLVYQPSIKLFYLKRFFRIYPTYIVCMVITFCVTNFLFITERSVGFKDFLLNFFVISDYIGGKYVDSSYWSLAIEILFYALAPFLFKRIMFFHGLIFISFINLYFHFYFLSALTLFGWLNFFYLGYLISVSSKIFSKLYFFKYLIVFINIFYLFGLEYLVVSIMIYFFDKVNLNYFNYTLQSFIMFIADVSFPLYLLHQNIGYYIIFGLLTSYNMNFSFIILFTLSLILLLSYYIHITVENKIKLKLFNL